MTSLAPRCAVGYIRFMKVEHDNTGRFGSLRPLQRMGRVYGKRDHSPAELEQWQAKRIFKDMQAFIPIRYPRQRNIVLATTFLTLGAAYAARAGVDASEVVQFVAEEQDKCA